MELYNKKDGSSPNDKPQQTPAPDPNQAVDRELHNEGVDLMGSGVREDNEFTGSEPEESEPVPTLTSTPAPIPVPPTTPVPPPPVLPPAPVVPQPAIPQKEPQTPPGVIRPSQVPTPAAIPTKNDPSIKPIRTFKTDAQEAVRYQNVSAVDIAVAEQKKKESNPIQYIEESKSHTGIAIASILFIMIALGGGWFYWNRPQNAGIIPEQVGVVVETIVPYAKGSTVVLRDDSDPITTIGTKLATSNAGLGNVYAVVPTLTATSTIAASVEKIFESTNMPNRLSRSLSPEYMIGTYAYEVNGPFIILKNTFFQNTFAGMLEWEKNMRNDLLPLIRVSYPSESPVTTETVPFSDMVISNIDARVLRNTEGKTILAYAFADNETIVITTHETTLQFLLGELLTVKSVQ